MPGRRPRTGMGMKASERGTPMQAPHSRERLSAIGPKCSSMGWVPPWAASALRFCSLAGKPLLNREVGGPPSGTYAGVNGSGIA
jgi:hypothetical protein